MPWPKGKPAHNRGKKTSAETCTKISEALKGLLKPAHHGSNVSATRKALGLKPSIEACKEGGRIAGKRVAEKARVEEDIKTGRSAAFLIEQFG